jgi:hypothetical protein
MRNIYANVAAAEELAAVRPAVLASSDVLILFRKSSHAIRYDGLLDAGRSVR